MKKRLSLILIVILALSFAACGKTGSNNRQTKSTGQTSATQQVTTGQIIQNVTTSTSFNNTSPTGALRFVVMGDSRGSDNGVNSAVVKGIMEKIKTVSPQPQFAIMPGDICSGSKSYSTTKAQLEYFKKLITAYYPIEFFYPGIGNHEIIAGPDGEKAFAEVFPEFKASFMEGYNRTVYYFDQGNTRFFMLNSDHPGEVHTISSIQQTWVKNNIDSGKAHNLYFIHEPAYPTGDHVGSSLDANLTLRNSLWKLFDTSAAPMAFCGHEHFYSKRHIDSSFNEKSDAKDLTFQKSIYQITTGGFGAPHYTGYTSKKGVDVPPIPEYHYIIVDINENKIKLTVYNIDNKIIDQFEQDKWQ